MINLAEYYEEFFTDDPEQASFIQGIPRSDIKQKLSEGYVVFVPTGLCNQLSIKIEANYYVKFPKGSHLTLLPLGNWI